MTEHLFPGLPLPEHYDPGKADQIWKVPYEKVALAAQSWAAQHAIQPASSDSFRIALLLVDIQNTFCLPDFELYVGGRSGTGAVDDNRRLAAFIYTNLGRLTEITATFDTHQAIQIFHAIYLIDEDGRHPAPHTQVSAEDILSGRWQFNPAVAHSLDISPEYGQEQLTHYIQQLEARQKYALTIWPYHSMLGGIGHALVPTIEEAVFFHTIGRSAQAEYIIKGANPFTESYSAIGPEVLEDAAGKQLARKNDQVIRLVEQFDAVLVGGQAKSHCVAWTMEDLLSEIQARDPALAGKVYLLEDCTSPVVVPGVIDYTPQADAAFQRFAAAGMHVVRSTDPLETWPGMPE
jgi:nicotinamidase-related amidase